MLTISTADPNGNINGDTSWNILDITSNILYGQVAFPNGKSWKKVTENYFIDFTNIPTDAEIAYWNMGGSSATPLTTKGDLYTHNGTNDARLAVGTTRQTLFVD